MTYKICPYCKNTVKELLNACEELVELFSGCNCGGIYPRYEVKERVIKNAREIIKQNRKE